MGDASGNSLPDWIDGTMAAMQKVFAEQVDRLSFPRPKNDEDSLTAPGGNPNGALDVYLANIGDDGFYGYCTSDDPQRFSRWDVSAYCVVDNDFAQSQFPGGVFGQAANRVTLAHEVHHAEQFALDQGEDIWIMEGGATAMERVVYPGIRDNYQYLGSSQIARPGIPLDLSSQRVGLHLRELDLLPVPLRALRGSQDHAPRSGRGSMRAKGAPTTTPPRGSNACSPRGIVRCAGSSRASPSRTAGRAPPTTCRAFRGGSTHRPTSGTGSAAASQDARTRFARGI